MKKLDIPTGEHIKEIPIKDNLGKTLCTVYFDPTDALIGARYKILKKSMERVFKRIVKVSLNGDGSPASARYAASVNDMEREVKRAITQFIYIDNPDGLFEVRPFARVGVDFYVTQVLDAIDKVIKKATYDIPSDLPRKRTLIDSLLKGGYTDVHF